MNEAEFQRLLACSGVSSPQASVKAKLFAETTEVLQATHVSSDHLHFWFVPGRIEFLGKHTDYAGGRSLLCALERGFCVASSARNDDIVRLTDARRLDHVQFNLSPGLTPRPSHWSNYPITVATRLAQNFSSLSGRRFGYSSGPSLRGADIAFISDLPPAAGLSSSSALIIAIFCVLARVNALDRTDEYTSNIRNREDLAGYLGTVENGQDFGSLAGSKGVGTFGGSQDHTAILCCRPGQLSQYSFCPVRYEQSIMLPGDYVFVIGVSGVSADKTGDARDKYNRISLMAAEVLAIWNLATGRADSTLMAAATSSSDAPERLRQVLRGTTSSSFSPLELLNRVEQFMLECFEIVPAVAQALAHRDVDRIGVFVDLSQEAAERFLGNQVPQTIALTRLARELGAVAASAFGAGFGGSVWAMVKSDHAEGFLVEWSERYLSKFPHSAKTSAFFLTCAGPSMFELNA